MQGLGPVEVSRLLWGLAVLDQLPKAAAGRLYDQLAHLPLTSFTAECLDQILQVPCPALPCRAVLCCAVLCCAVLCCVPCTSSAVMCYAICHACCVSHFSCCNVPCCAVLC